MIDHIYELSYIQSMNIPTNSLFSALANEIRLRCLILMQHNGELCVCELTHTLGLSQPMISRHLALLRDDSLVEARREGQWMYYRIHTDLPKWANTILETTAQACEHEQPFNDDLLSLEDMPNRPGSACCA